MFGLFKKRVNPEALALASSATERKLAENIDLFCRLQAAQTTLADVEEAINKSVETQMFALAVSTTLLDFYLQDAYYDMGLAGPLSPMPDHKMTTDETRQALRSSWQLFRLPPTRMNLDMRYRHTFVNGLNSPQEKALWQQMEQWSAYEVRRSFEAKQSLNTDWIGFCIAMRDGDLDLARRFLSGGPL